MPEAHHTIQEREEFPKGVGNVQGTDMVQVIMREDMARYFEQHMLKSRSLHLAGPMIFGEDDLPSYIIGIGEGNR